MIHITDLMPTIGHLAGFTSAAKWDGHNVWETVSTGASSPRQDVLGHFDQLTPYASYIKGRWKIVNGTTSARRYDGWLGEVPLSERDSIMMDNYGATVLTSKVGQSLRKYDDQMDAATVELHRGLSKIACNFISETDAADDGHHCDPQRAICLFDLLSDPCEQKNVAAKHPDIVQELRIQLDKFKKSAVTPRNRESDIRSNPKNFNNTWTWWYDELGIEMN